MTDGGGRERLVEHRLRQALEARAESVTVRKLRPAAPPRRARPRPWWRRGPVSRAGRTGLAGLATAAVAGLAYLTLAPAPADPHPVPPAVPPATTSPTPGTPPDGTPTAPPTVTPSPAPSTTPQGRSPGGRP